MEPFPNTLSIPYRLDPRWLESQVLAGNLVKPTGVFHLKMAEIPKSERRRALRIARAMHFRNGQVEVVGSGIRPSDAVRDDENKLTRASTFITSRIGEAPLLPNPEPEPSELFDACIAWLHEYEDLSRAALAHWVDHLAAVRASSEFVSVSLDRTVRIQIPWQLETKESGSLTVNGLEKFNLFWTARKAWQFVELARDLGAEEDLEIAAHIVGDCVVIPSPAVDAEVVVDLFSEYARRYFEISIANMWTRKQTDENFEREMIRWATARGSDRLRIGIEDGYRMVPVYLDERIGAEAPGCFATRVNASKDFQWQRRTGPTGIALQIRRAVEERLRDDHSHLNQCPEVLVGWVKSAPEAMCIPVGEHDAIGFEVDNHDGEFEAIIIPGWLGRYDLVGAIDSRTHRVPHFIRADYILQPKSFGLAPESEPAQFMPSEDDIPF